VTYYVPQHFTQLVNKLQPDYGFKFDPQLTYQLYHGLVPSAYSQKIIDAIFEQSKESQALTLKYLEAFPRREVPLKMEESNPEVENAAKIFLLVREVPKENEQWMQAEWDIRKQLIAYDPRITLKDLEIEEEDEDVQLYNLYFRPSNRTIPAQYDNPALDPFRFRYFYESLQDSERSHYIRYLLPFINDILLPRNKQFVEGLFASFA
jgi:hypothetical protein